MKYLRGIDLTSSLCRFSLSFCIISPAVFLPVQPFFPHILSRRCCECCHPGFPPFLLLRPRVFYLQCQFDVLNFLVDLDQCSVHSLYSVYFSCLLGELRYIWFMRFQYIQYEPSDFRHNTVNLGFRRFKARGFKKLTSLV